MKTKSVTKKCKKTDSANLDLLQLIIDNISCFIFWKDKNLKFLGCNAFFAKSVGLKNACDIVGKTEFDIMPNCIDAEEFEKVDEQVIKSGTPIKYEMKALGKNDEWLEVSKLPLKDTNGKIIGVIGVLKDITEHVKLREKLIGNSKKYRGLIEVTQTAYVILDTSFKITEVNNIFEQLMNCASGQMIGDNLRSFISSEDMKKFDNMAELLLDGKFINNLEMALITSDKRQIVVTLSANMLENGDKKIICLLRDISNKKTEEAKKYIKQQQQKDKLRQDITLIRNAFQKMVK